MATNLYQLSEQVGALLHRHGQIVTTAESCTGGWIAKSLTDIAGSSEWFEAGFITYSNQAKERMVGVSAELLALHGAVSEEVVDAMMRGALKRSGADCAVAVSGIAGPGGGTADKPVGTVWLGWCNRDGLHQTVQKQFVGNRQAVREQTVQVALEGIIDLYSKKG